METDYRSLGDEIKAIREKTEETNRLIRAMRRDAIIFGILKAVFWVVVLVGSYYLTMQYLEPLLGSMTGNSEGSSFDFNELLQQYQELTGQQ